jgi:hypothetical protein
MRQTVQLLFPRNGHLALLRARRTRDRSGSALRMWLVLGLLMTGAAQAQSTPASPLVTSGQPTVKDSAAHLKINVIFEKLDSENRVILKYGALVIKTRLAGVKIRPGAAGVLGMLLPEGARLQAEFVEKGTIPAVVLWKGTVNLNEQLLIQGVAEGIR